MYSINLCENDAATILESLGEIHEISEIQLSDDIGLRYALANLIGSIRDAKALEKNRNGRGRVSLEDLLKDKFEKWEEGDNRLSADKVLTFHLENSERSTVAFVGGNGSSSSVHSFRYAFDHEVAWQNCELSLCASSSHEIEKKTLQDLVHELVLCS